MQEQVAVVLSGYTATLNPSDRAILHFVQLCEENSVDLTEFKPILFGKEAVRQYTAKVGEGDCTDEGRGCSWQGDLSQPSVVDPDPVG